MGELPICAFWECYSRQAQCAAARPHRRAASAHINGPAHRARGGLRPGPRRGGGMHGSSAISQRSIMRSRQSVSATDIRLGSLQCKSGDESGLLGVWRGVFFSIPLIQRAVAPALEDCCCRLPALGTKPGTLWCSKQSTNHTEGVSIEGTDGRGLETRGYEERVSRDRMARLAAWPATTAP